MKKVMEFLRSAEMKAAVLASIVLTALSSTASAADETITNAFTTGFTAMVTDSTAMIASIVPIAIGLAGTVFVIKKAMGWFKSLAR